MVYKGVWHGLLVAAKIIPIQGIDASMLEKKLSTLRCVNKFHNEFEGFLYSTLHHPNLLSLIGIIYYDTYNSILTNFVNGKNLHSNL